MKLNKSDAVLKKLDVSKSTLIRWVNSGFFPQPTKLGKDHFWLESAVDEWISQHFEVKAKKGGAA